MNKFKVKKILLIHIGKKTSNFFLATPPLGLMYISSYIKSKRPYIDIKIHDMKIDNTNTEEVRELAINYKPDLIGLSVISPNSNHLPGIYKTIKKSLNVPIIIGGAHVSSLKEGIFDNLDADFACDGEGEEVTNSFIEVLEKYNYGNIENKKAWLQELRSIPGLLVKTDEGKIIANPPRIIENIDDLPFPDYDNIDIEGYARNFSMTPLGHRKYMSIFTSRGCPYKCYYCHNIFGKKFRYRSVDKVVNEIELLNKKYKIKHFEIIDDIFNLNKKRVIDICNEIVKRNLKIKISFPNGLRGDILDKSVIDALKTAGTIFISFAIETASPELQKKIGKYVNLEKIKQNIDYTASIGIFCNGFFMLGFPEESKEEILKTINFAAKLKLHIASFFIVTPYSGTKLFDSLSQTPDKQIMNFTDYDSIFGEANCSTLDSKELYKLQRYANRKFYLNPNRIYRILRDLPLKRNLFTFIGIFFKRAFHRKNRTKK